MPWQIVCCSCYGIMGKDWRIRDWMKTRWECVCHVCFTQLCELGIQTWVNKQTNRLGIRLKTNSSTKWSTSLQFWEQIPYLVNNYNSNNTFCIVILVGNHDAPKESSFAIKYLGILRPNCANRSNHKDWHNNICNPSSEIKWK